MCIIYTRKGRGREVTGPIGSRVTGQVDAQPVVEGGGGINKCCAGGITVLYWVAVSFS